MRPLWTPASVALAFSVVCLAYPQRAPWDSYAPQQQRPFLPSRQQHHLDNPNTNQNQDTVHSYARFDQEQVLRVEVASVTQLKQLEATVAERHLDLWSNLRIGTVDVRVPAHELEAFKQAIPFPSTVMIPNLQDLIPDQPPASSLLPYHNGWNYTENTFWEQYHDFETLNNFTETMIQQFPRLVSRVSIGKTYEGREVFGLSIHGYRDKKDKKDKKHKKHKRDKKHRKHKKKKGHRQVDFVETDVEEDFYEFLGDEVADSFGELEDVNEDVDEEDDGDEDEPSWMSWLERLNPYRKPSKPKKNPKSILLHAGQHAREWIGPAVVTYIAKELILGYGKSKKITRLVDQFEFIIVPVLNADGYVYTWEHNRMWRKNRQPTSIPFCPGIDPNRNWGYLWNTGGSSNNPCDEGYHGPEAFSALEAKMMADFILSKKESVVAYVDFHAYSQLWMSPFGADCSKTPKDDEDILEASMGAAKALHDVNGKKFAVGSVCNIIYQSSGGSIDWTYAEGKVKYSYGVELRDTGRYGFLLPPGEILPSSKETMAGIMYLANFIRKREKQWSW